MEEDCTLKKMKVEKKVSEKIVHVPEEKGMIVKMKEGKKIEVEKGKESGKLWNYKTGSVKRKILIETLEGRCLLKIEETILIDISIKEMRAKEEGEILRKKEIAVGGRVSEFKHQWNKLDSIKSKTC